MNPERATYCQIRLVCSALSEDHPDRVRKTGEVQLVNRMDGRLLVCPADERIRPFIVPSGIHVEISSGDMLPSVAPPLVADGMWVGPCLDRDWRTCYPDLNQRG